MVRVVGELTVRIGRGAQMVSSTNIENRQAAEKKILALETPLPCRQLVILSMSKDGTSAMAAGFRTGRPSQRESARKTNLSGI
jgi:hypothetical protein